MRWQEAATAGHGQHSSPCFQTDMNSKAECAWRRVVTNHSERRLAAERQNAPHLLLQDLGFPEE
jgi:hypothetical protein